MPRLTPEELKETRERKAEERQLAEEEQARVMLEEKEEANRKNELYEKYRQLKSYVNGLHDEAGKLSSKRPSESTTELVVKSTNYAIGIAKALIPGEDDKFLAELKQFVDTDKSVENRDITVALRQVKDALNRLRDREGWRQFPYDAD